MRRSELQATQSNVDESHKRMQKSGTLGQIWCNSIHIKFKESQNKHLILEVRIPVTSEKSGDQKREILIMFHVSTWDLVTRVCSLCDNLTRQTQFVHFSECYTSIKIFKCKSDKCPFEEIFLFLMEITCLASFLSSLPELNSFVSFRQQDAF